MTATNIRRASHRTALVAHRRGTILVGLGIGLTILFAVAAVVIDMGLCRQAQRQMAGAADTAAVEGLRFRDHFPDAWLADPPVWFADLTQQIGDPPATPQTATDADWIAWRNRARRYLANRLVRQTFDDDLNPDNGDLGPGGDGQGEFGAGGVLTEAYLGPGIEPLGVSEYNALKTITGIGVYKPNLQLNEADEPHGDLVAGSYSASAEQEQPDYARSDFTAQPAGSAFLARLRRTNDFLGLDQIPEVSSAGPTMPFLFGRGTFIHENPDPTANPNGYRPRHDGVTVRGTSIAAAQAARSVGVAAGSNLPGCLSRGIYLADWVSDDLNQAHAISLAGALTLGMLLENNGADPDPGLAEDALGYLPIVGNVGEPFENRVLAFGAVVGADSGLVKLAGVIGPLNASAALLPLSESERAAVDWGALWIAHQAVPDPLLVPVLVR